MISHILVPLDGSALAECVLPHVRAIASAFEVRITLLHVLEYSHVGRGEQAFDSLDWHLRKREAQVYLHEIAARLQYTNLDVKHIILQGPPAECIIDFANNNDVDLIVLSTHGRSGLSGWNLSSVAQKIIARSYKSAFLVRAYESCSRESADIRYDRLFVGMDGSTRAEYILPTAIALAQFHKAQLILGMVIRRPEILHRLPPSKEDLELVTCLTDMNYCAASQYLEQLHSQLSLQGIDLQTRLVISDNLTASLHDLVEQENADLVMLAAHGQSGKICRPYGSVATSFIAYGTIPLMIIQDLSGDQIKQARVEMVGRETQRR